MVESSSWMLGLLVDTWQLTAPCLDAVGRELFIPASATATLWRSAWDPVSIILASNDLLRVGFRILKFNYIQQLCIFGGLVQFDITSFPLAHDYNITQNHRHITIITMLKQIALYPLLILSASAKKHKSKHQTRFARNPLPYAYHY